MLTGMTVIAALLLAVSMTPATAATGIVARWKLDDPKTPANGPVADSVGTHPGTVGDTTGTLIKRRQPPVTGAGTNTYSYYFKGWREGWSTSNMCPSVTPNGALVTVSDRARCGLCVPPCRMISASNAKKMTPRRMTMKTPRVCRAWGSVNAFDPSSARP